MVRFMGPQIVTSGAIDEAVGEFLLRWMIAPFVRLTRRSPQFLARILGVISALVSLIGGMTPPLWAAVDVVGALVYLWYVVVRTQQIEAGSSTTGEALGPGWAVATRVAGRRPTHFLFWLFIAVEGGSNMAVVFGEIAFAFANALVWYAATAFVSPPAKRARARIRLGLPQLLPVGT